jgi:anti-sigma B factor antagonist
MENGDRFRCELDWTRASLPHEPTDNGVTDTQRAQVIPTIAIEGRITINNSDEVRRKLLAALRLKPGKVTVDLSQATYMDTSGLATLLEAVRIARKQGTRFVLAGVDGQPRCLFQIETLDRLFEFARQETGS